MTLELIDILNGSLSLIFNTLSIVVGLRISYKYFKTKDDQSRFTYLYFGLALIGLAFFWLPTSVSFIIYLTFFFLVPNRSANI